MEMRRLFSRHATMLCSYAAACRAMPLRDCLRRYASIYRLHAAAYAAYAALYFTHARIADELMLYVARRASRCVLFDV